MTRRLQIPRNSRIDFSDSPALSLPALSLPALSLPALSLPALSSPALGLPVLGLFTLSLFMGTCFLSSSANAAVELTELLSPGGSLAVDTLLFDQFSFSSDGSMPSSSGVIVDTITDASGNVGIRVTGGFSDTTATAGPSSMELNYRVSTTNGSNITGATLAGNPAVIGEGKFTVTESSDGFEMSLVVFDSVPGQTDLLESISLDGTSSSLDISLSLVGDVTEGAGTASFVDQTFAQGMGGNNVVPEPASILIWGGTLLLGAVGVCSRRNR